MDQYSILDAPSPRGQGNGAASEEGPQAPPTGASVAANDVSPQEIATNEVFGEVAAAETMASASDAEVANEPPAEEPVAAPDVDATLQSIVQRAQYITSANGAAIALRQGPDVVCRAASGNTAPDHGARLEIKSGLTAECLRTGQVMRCDNAVLDPRVDLESCKRLGIESIIIMPIHRGQELVGVLELFSAHAYSFQERDVDTVKELAGTISNALAQADKQPTLRTYGQVDERQRGLTESEMCSGCGARIAKDSVFCTSCGGFQESKPAGAEPAQSAAWKQRVGGRRLIVPAIFVAMALVVAVAPMHRRSAGTANLAAPVASTARKPSVSDTRSAPTGQAPGRSQVEAANNPGITKSVKQLLGGVSSDFSKLLPVNEKPEPPSSGDPNLKVWVDTRKGFYYCPGDEQYGHTDKGTYMSQKDAESNYYIPALIKPCT